MPDSSFLISGVRARARFLALGVSGSSLLVTSTLSPRILANAFSLGLNLQACGCSYAQRELLVFALHHQADSSRKKMQVAWFDSLDW